MARASTPTLLALDRYAKIMGIPLPHFNSAYADTAFPLQGACSQVVWQHPWQYYDAISREDLARCIFDAEEEIKRLVGYSPAPVWQVEEVQPWPRHHRPDVYGPVYTERLDRKAIKTDLGHIISCGQRAVTLVATPTTAAAGITYTDANGDGVIDTATVTCATTATNVQQLKVYFAGHAGESEWEIRPCRTKTLVGGVFTATFYVWQFIDPDLWEFLPTEYSPTPLDYSDTDNLVTSVNVYQEYTDTTATSCQLWWEPSSGVVVFSTTCSVCGGAGCTACAHTLQDGCAHIRDSRLGWVVPTAATYDADNDEWDDAALDVCREPDFVKLWYYSGDMDQRYLKNQTFDPLSDYWAKIIAWIATARLERPFCSCGTAQDLAEDLRTDLAHLGKGERYLFSFDDLTNPLGTRKGEVVAWHALQKVMGGLTKGVAIG